MSDASLFLHIGLSLSFCGLVGLGIGRALDAWVRRAPETAPPAAPEDTAGTEPAEAPPHSGARIR